MQKAVCLCLALIAAALLAVPVVALVAWANLATGVLPDWVAVVAYHVAFACGAVALYRRWLPRVAAGHEDTQAG